MKKPIRIGLTVSQLVDCDKDTLLCGGGIVFTRAVLPYFMPHLVTIDLDTDVETWIAGSCHTSITLANFDQIKNYVDANRKTR